MKYKLVNNSENFKRLLKHWFAPGEEKFLEDLFSEFSGSGGRIPPMFGPDQYDEFVTWVVDLVRDINDFDVIDESGKVYKVNGRSKGSKRKKNRNVEFDIPEGVKNHFNKVSVKDFKGHHLAWLPFNDDTKKIISEYPSVVELKKAEKIASGLSGRAKLRQLLLNRINELQLQGVTR
jgi:hypothetical protein